MSLPSFPQLLFPSLAALCQKQDETSLARVEEEVARSFRLSPQDRGQLAPSGHQTLFANRLNWARLYLVKAGLAEPTRRGYARATERGRALIAEGVRDIDVDYLGRYPEFRDWRDRYPARGPAAECEAPERPEERISACLLFASVRG